MINLVISFFFRFFLNKSNVVVADFVSFCLLYFVAIV